MKELILAIQFLTRIPINVNIETEEDSFAKSILWFPIAGLLVGGFNAAVYWISSFLLEGIFPIVCVALANVCVTGALHVDGLADTCDGIFSARKRDRMLEIMKDSRIGTIGAIAITFDIILRIAVLLNLTPKHIFLVLLIAPTASKAILTLIMKISVYARREGGMGGLFLGRQGWSRTVIAMMFGIAIVGLVLGLVGLAAFAAAMVIAFLFRIYIYNKIQGMTGDTIGASNEVIELVFFFACALIWRQLL